MGRRRASPQHASFVRLSRSHQEPRIGIAVELGRARLGRPLREAALKLERAVAKLRELLPKARIDGVPGGLGEGAGVTVEPAGVVVVGSVLMPIMELRGGTLADGLVWLRTALADLVGRVRPGGWLYDLETLAAPWACGRPMDPVRRLTLPELTDEIARAGFETVECAYRFRDRVTVKARRP